MGIVPPHLGDVSEVFLGYPYLDGVEMLGKRGLTVIELLVVISVLAILFGLVETNLLSLRQHLTLEDAVNTFSQDVQTCRTNALSWGITAVSAS